MKRGGGNHAAIVSVPVKLAGPPKEQSVTPEDPCKIEGDCFWAGIGSHIIIMRG